MIDEMRSSCDGVRDEARHVVGGRRVLRQQTGRIRVVRVFQSELGRLSRSCARMKPSDPCGDTRASARAAALSDAMSSRCSRSSVVTLSFACRCVVDAWKTSLRAIVTGCVSVGIVLEEDRRRHHLGDAGNRALALRVLFPEHLIGFGVVDDRRGRAHIRERGRRSRRPCTAAAPCRQFRAPSRRRVRCASFALRVCARAAE